MVLYSFSPSPVLDFGTRTKIFNFTTKAADINIPNSIQTEAILIVSAILHVKLNLSIEATFFHETALITPPTGKTFHP